jgi:bifunctional non-homologous end joining protein LigD
MTGKLSEYRDKRDPRRTPEPVPKADATPRGDSELPTGADGTFVIQEHHARALHWDFRLERDGVLVSWAIPKGIPLEPKSNHLAVHTEDHPLEYADFSGQIPAGEYGGGQVIPWDRGSYSTEKWTDREVKVVLQGGRIQGRYVLFQTNGRNWMIHRMDPPPRERWQSLPELISPMLAIPGALPPRVEDQRWAYETKWDGARAIVYVDGGRVRALSRNDRDITVSYPELRRIGEQLGTTQAVIDGEIVAFGSHGLPSFSRLQRRMHVSAPTQALRLASSDPVIYMIFDLLHLEGASTLGLPYRERRQLLEQLDLNGDSWRTPRYFLGGGTDVLRANQEHGLEGIVAKRMESTYYPGRRSPDWRKIKNVRTQEVVIGGWRPGRGSRANTIGSLLMGIPASGGLEYVGRVGTGFSADSLRDLLGSLTRLSRKTSPFRNQLPRADSRDVRWTTPRLVGEVAFTEWTADGRLRHPSWRGLRPDKSPGEVVKESGE